MTLALDTRLRKRPGIKWKRIGKAGILLDLRTGNYFELDETALAIWTMLDGKSSLSRVVDRLARAYACPRQTVERDVVSFASELRKRKLIETVNS